MLQATKPLLTDEIAAALVGRRHACAFAILGFAFVLLARVSALEFESDYRIFFDDSNPQLQAYDQLQATFTRVDDISFVVETKGETLFVPEHLAALRQLTDRAWQLPHSVRVDSVVNFQHIDASDDELEVRDLLPRNRAPTRPEAAEARAIALGEPQLLGLLLAPDTRVSAVSVRLHLPDGQALEERATAEVVAAARAVVADFEKTFPDLRVRLLGEVVITTAFLESAQRDFETLVPLMFVVVALLIALLFRSLGAAFATLVVVALTIASTLGLLAWSGYALNQVSVTAPTIILTIAICDSLHLLSSYMGNLGAFDRASAMRRALALNVQPITLTSFTTAVGFLALNFSESPPFRELGNVVAAGVALAFLITLGLLPTLAVALDLPARPNHPRRSQLLRKVAQGTIRHRRAIVAGAVLLAIPLLAGISRNQIDDRTVGYFHESTAFREAADFLEERLTGFDYLAYSLESGRAGGATDVEFLQRVDAFTEWWRAQPGVAHVDGFTDVVKRVNRALHGGDAAAYRIPEDPHLAAQAILLYELSLPAGLDLATHLDLDRSATRVMVRLRHAKRADLIGADARAQQWFAQHAPELASVGAGVSVMFAHIGLRNIESMFQGSLFALIVISITLVVAFRSLRIGLLSILPNALPAAIALGLWGYLDGGVNLAVAAVFSVTLGIIVDDTVHFLSKYRRARQALGMEAGGAIAYAFDEVGEALVATTIALTAGFCMLALSSFEVNAAMGKMVAITLGVALAFDMIVLPAILALGDQSKSQAPDQGAHNAPSPIE